MLQPVVFQRFPESREARWQTPGVAEPVIVPFAINSANPDKLLLTGFGEDNIEEIAEELWMRGVSDLAVCSMVYAPDASGRFTPDSVERSVLSGTKAVVRAMTVGDPYHGIQPIIGIGNSKGAGEQILAASRYPWLWSQLLENAPLGVTNQSLGPDLRTRRRELIGRLKVAELDKTHAMSEAQLNEMKYGINYALGTDGAGMVRMLHRLGLMRRLFVGEHDVVFPPHEFERDLGLQNFVETIEGAGHISLTGAPGLDHMARIITLGLSDEPELRVAA